MVQQIPECCERFLNNFTKRLHCWFELKETKMCLDNGIGQE